MVTLQLLAGHNPVRLGLRGARRMYQRRNGHLPKRCRCFKTLAHVHLAGVSGELGSVHTNYSLDSEI